MLAGRRSRPIAPPSPGRKKHPLHRLLEIGSDRLLNWAFPARMVQIRQSDSWATLAISVPSAAVIDPRARPRASLWVSATAS